MHNRPISSLAALASQLNSACQQQDWQQVQWLDSQLQQLLQRTDLTQLNPVQQRELTYLRWVHQQVLTQVCATSSQMQQRLQDYQPQKERSLAYQLVMDVEA